MHIVFLHIDLGIGGAEQLIINLALASISKVKSEPDIHKSLHATVTICTTHCDPSHCFASVKPPDGVLSGSIDVVGSFLPIKFFGKYGTAFCSTIRLFYLAVYARIYYPDADLIVVDILPTPLPFLIASRVSSVLYYCHFPDKLLTRDTINGIQISTNKTEKTRGPVQRFTQIFKTIYRRTLNWAEELTMSYADLICVNSKFTRDEVLRVFPSIRSLTEWIHILYPAIDLSKFITPDFDAKERMVRNSMAPIVSLNRFERKKNIELLLRVYANLVPRFEAQQMSERLPPLIIAGGYDPRNEENHEYLKELQNLCDDLGIRQFTTFRPSISDDDRAVLLKSALCLCYTPFREHFGIVPLEAMYAGSAVVALKSGGPMETVLDGETGFLIPMDESNNNHSINLFADALWYLITNPSEAIRMGKVGHLHVKNNFGLDKFAHHWAKIVRETMQRGRLRRDLGKSSTLARLWLILIPIVYYISRKL